MPIWPCKVKVWLPLPALATTRWKTCSIRKRTWSVNNSSQSSLSLAKLSHSWALWRIIRLCRCSMQKLATHSLARFSRKNQALERQPRLSIAYVSEWAHTSAAPIQSRQELFKSNPIEFWTWTKVSQRLISSSLIRSLDSFRINRWMISRPSTTHLHCLAWWRHPSSLLLHPRFKSRLMLVKRVWSLPSFCSLSSSFFLKITEELQKS